MGLAACAADPKIMLSDDGKEVTPVKAAGGQPGRGARVESARKRAEEAGARKREQKVAEEHESRLLADDADARAELEGIVAASVAAAVQKESARVTAQLTALTRTLEALSHRATFLAAGAELVACWGGRRRYRARPGRRREHRATTTRPTSARRPTPRRG